MREESKPWFAVRFFAVLLAAILVLWSVLVPALAAEEVRTVIPLGRAVGIKLFSDGVVVVGTSAIETDGGAVNPAEECGLQTGDVITHINSEEVDTIEEVREVLQELEGQPMSIRATRSGRQVQLTAQAVQCSADGSYKLGAWIRDSMAGIGTMTFYDPSTGTFGALGHGVSDSDTALLMPLETGSILSAQVAGVQKGVSGTPGLLKGAFQVQQDLGQLSANTDRGIFGTLEDTSMVEGLDPVPVASRDQVTVGDAVILSNISGDEVKEYTVRITRIFRASETDTRDLMLEVTDPELLAITGGVVQGMSGSPIIQDGRIVGAVTHVLVNDPTTGYGIFIENMLDAAE